MTSHLLFLAVNKPIHCPASHIVISDWFTWSINKANQLNAVDAEHCHTLIRTNTTANINIKSFFATRQIRNVKTELLSQEQFSFIHVLNHRAIVRLKHATSLNLAVIQKKKIKRKFYWRSTKSLVDNDCNYSICD